MAARRQARRRARSAQAGSALPDGDGPDNEGGSSDDVAGGGRRKGPKTAMGKAPAITRMPWTRVPTGRTPPDRFLAKRGKKIPRRMTT